MHAEAQAHAVGVHTRAHTSSEDLALAALKVPGAPLPAPPCIPPAMPRSRNYTVPQSPLPRQQTPLPYLLNPEPYTPTCTGTPGCQGWPCPSACLWTLRTRARTTSTPSWSARGSVAWPGEPRGASSPSSLALLLGPRSDTFVHQHPPPAAKHAPASRFKLALQRPRAAWGWLWGRSWRHAGARRKGHVRFVSCSCTR